jgi:hypothetical protein
LIRPWAGEAPRRERRPVSTQHQTGEARQATDTTWSHEGPLSVRTSLERPIGGIDNGRFISQARARSTILDEKIGGTVRLALGRSYPESKGTNISALHWDLICDLRQGGRITADGVTIQEDGHFKL